MPFPAMPNQITCPQCSARFLVSIHTIIDVGQEPELKEQFLSGQINHAACPECGAGGMLSTALLYHDPAKELLISYVPTEMGLSVDDQEKLVGSLVKAVMDSVPQEERKGYFLQPKTVLTYEGLFDAVLIGEGYTQEQLQAQRNRLQLIQSLLTNVDDNETLQSMIDENKAQLDYEFLLMLSGVIEDQRNHGDEEGAKALETLRDKLLDQIDLSSTAMAPQQHAGSYEELITMLAEADESAVKQIVAQHRAQLDYGFFQALTGQIEAAENDQDQAKAEQLTTLRESVLQGLETLDRTAREAQDQASLLIMQLSKAEDVTAAVRDQIGQINETVLTVLLRYIETARGKDDAELLAKLEAILQAITDVLEERLPPDVRLINQLARGEYPEETGRIMEKNRGLLNQDLLAKLDQYLEQMQGHDEDQEMREHLQQVRSQAAAKLTILRG